MIRDLSEWRCWSRLRLGVVSSDLLQFDLLELDAALSCPGRRDESCAHWDHTVQLFICCDHFSPHCDMELGRWITAFRRYTHTCTLKSPQLTHTWRFCLLQFVFFFRLFFPRLQKSRNLPGWQNYDSGGCIFLRALTHWVRVCVCVSSNKSRQPPITSITSTAGGRNYDLITRVQCSFSSERQSKSSRFVSYDAKQEGKTESIYTVCCSRPTRSRTHNSRHTDVRAGVEGSIRP